MLLLLMLVLFIIGCVSSSPNFKIAARYWVRSEVDDLGVLLVARSRSQLGASVGSSADQRAVPLRHNVGVVVVG